MEHPIVASGYTSNTAYSGSTSAFIDVGKVYSTYYSVEQGDRVDASAWIYQKGNSGQRGHIEIELFLEGAGGTISLGVVKIDRSNSNQWLFNEITNLYISYHGNLKVQIKEQDVENWGLVDELSITIHSTERSLSEEELNTSSSLAYRYGYQGQFAEKDEETGWNSFELRQYDSRSGRWLIPDPYRQHWSPYLAMGNNPINLIDPNGGLGGVGVEYSRSLDGASEAYGVVLSNVPVYVTGLAGGEITVINGNLDR